MNDHEDRSELPHAQCLPTFLAINELVKLGQFIGIVKNFNGNLEAEAVLGLVDPILIFVPFEVHAQPPPRQVRNVTTLL